MACVTKEARSYRNQTQRTMEITWRGERDPRISRIMNIILLGPQGSGKGVQSELLSKHLGAPHVSVGDLIREDIQRGTATGIAIKSIVEKGGLAPDDIVLKIIEKKLTECSRGAIFDGFPRTLTEAEWLDEQITVDKVIELYIPDSLAIARISSRTQCEKCHRIYGKDIPPKKKGI